jgi:predicted Zn-dependent peptidase
MFLNPSLDEEEFDKEKGVILAEIFTRESDPISALYDKFPSLLYEVHPYRRPVAGPPQTVEKMTLADVATFFYTHYTANRMTLALVGDFETSKIMSQVKEKCSALRQGEPQEVNFPEQRPIEAPREKIETKGFPLAYLMIGWHGVKVLDADFYPLQLLGYILSGGKSSRLDQQITESGLASEVYLIFEPSYQAGAISFLVVLSRENIDKVKEIIFAEIADIKAGNVTEEELRRAKALYKSNFERADEKALDIALHAGYFATIADIDFYNNLLGNIDKVTTGDVDRVCQKYLGENNYAVLTFTPEVR